MKKIVFFLVSIVLSATGSLSAQNISNLNNYKYVVIRPAIANESVAKYKKIKPDLEAGLKNLLALYAIPILADENEGLQKGVKNSEIVTCTYTLTYSNMMMYVANISAALSFTDFQNKEIYRVRGTKDVGAAVGVDGYLKLYAEIMKPNNAYRYSYIQAQASANPSSTPTQDMKQSASSPELPMKQVKPVAKILSDVDVNIPVSSSTNAHKYALIIGNEDYSSFETGLSSEVNVDFAINDAEVFKDYCAKTLGIPAEQIKFLKNATAAQIRRGLSWIANLAEIEGGKAELIFYYSGHGLPDEQSKEPYIIPVDVSADNITDGVKLNDVYGKLTQYASTRVSCFIDACFSGGARNAGLRAEKGIKIKPKETTISENMIVLASSTGDESSGVYREKQHGYMTYFLLKKLQETKGDVSYSQLGNYVKENVRKSTALSGKIQTPQMMGGIGIKDLELVKLK